MDGKRTRRRRAIRAVAYVILTPVLLLGGYLCSVVSFCFLASAGVLPDAVLGSPAWEVFVVPIQWYVSSHLPGADAYNFIVELACDAGERILHGN